MDALNRFQSFPLLFYKHKLQRQQRTVRHRENTGNRRRFHVKIHQHDVGGGGSCQAVALQHAGYMPGYRPGGVAEWSADAWPWLFRVPVGCQR